MSLEQQVPRRVLRAILANPALRRKLMVACIIATQAREGITTTEEQAEAAYDAVQKRDDDGPLHT
jgi:hypothetical protein